MSDLPDLENGIRGSELAAGKMVAGTYRGERVVLLRRDDGIVAVSGECTHLGAPLETGVVVDGEIRCPWHHARFSASSGEAVGGPAIKPLGCFDVAETDATIRVTGRRGAAPVPAGGAVSESIVIIGSGGAGYALARELAKAGEGDRVTLITREDEQPYDRTYLSKQYLAGGKGRDDCFLPHGEDGLPGVTVRTATPVASIDRNARTICTEKGEEIAYDVLVLANGARPVMPDFPGSERDNVFQLRSLADADSLIAAAEKAGSAVVLGASFIGLEVAASLRERGLSVDVVDQSAVPLEPVLGSQIGKFVQGLHEDHEVRFHLGRQIAGFDGTSVSLDNGAQIPADLLVVGAGVAPCSDLAKQAGLALDADNGGVTVDGRFRTDDPAIRAIGDLASYPDPRLGQQLRIEHWVLAQRHGEHLAWLLLGRSDAPFSETPFFWSGHFGTQLRYVGHAAKPDPVHEEGKVEDGEFAIFFGKQGGPDEAQALASCGRDRQTLEVEASWNRSGASLA
ncbi:FAD-dependent oxidoreductase [Croceicoccus mobilis]|nr:FAD-dependent oxidoreductase [Croceicoccus mobilis]